MPQSIEDVLAAAAGGELPLDAAAQQLHGMMDAAAGFSDLGYARPDLARAHRQGAGEVIYGAGKTADQVFGIARALVEAGQPRVLATRLDPDKAAAVAALWAKAALGPTMTLGDDMGAPAGDVLSALCTGGTAGDGVLFAYCETARLGVFGGLPVPDGDGPVVIAVAGTSDIPVAEEAAITAQFLGNEVVRLLDVGVAGIHSLLACAGDLERAQVVIAVAGMEGALASVVGGMASCPVIAVPTSVGYGASFGGVAALLSMLNSCASGVSVVNIDNGFGAAYQASMINHLGSRRMADAALVAETVGEDAAAEATTEDAAAAGQDAEDAEESAAAV